MTESYQSVPDRPDSLPGPQTIVLQQKGFSWLTAVTGVLLMLSVLLNFVLLIAVAGLSWWFGQNTYDGTIELATGNAETRTVELADGSVITLNNASKIRYRHDLAGDERHIVLSGEAYFDVAPAQRPFVVQTENASIRVLGTEFNIWARERETRVIVSEGKVSLRNTAAGDSVELIADQMAICTGDNAPEAVLTVDSDTAIGWRTGRIVFDETRLTEVVAELRRIYDVEIVLQDSALLDLSIAGSFQQKPLEDVLEAICLSLGIRYRVEGQRYVIGE